MNYNNPIKYEPIPTTPGPITITPGPEVSTVVEDAPIQEATESKKLYPARTEFFTNDLTPEAKEEIVKMVEAQTRATLSEPKVTVNAVSRMFGIEHNKVKRQCNLVSGSLTTFVNTRGNAASLAKIAQSINRLTPSEKKLLMTQLQKTE